MHLDLSLEGNLIVMKLAIESFGTGEPLVLIHGMGSAATAWNPIISDLKNKFKVSQLIYLVMVEPHIHQANQWTQLL